MLRIASYRILAVGAVVMLALACGDDAVPPVGGPIEGGGIGGAALSGSLTVFVGDVAPMSGVGVVVGEQMALSDADGVVRFDGLGSAETVDVTVLFSPPVEWRGVAASELTVTPLGDVIVEPREDTALEGTIVGFDELAHPAGGYTFAILDTSHAQDVALGRAPVAGLSTTDPEALGCLKDDSGARCDFVLSAVAGPQVVFALIAEGMDTEGTPRDISDDVFTSVGFAALEVDVPPMNPVVSGLELPLLTPDQLAPLDVEVIGEPIGTTAVIGVPGIAVDGSGIVVFPVLPGVTRYLGPELDGTFAGATYWLIGTAEDGTGAHSRAIARRLRTEPIGAEPFGLRADGFLPFVSTPSGSLSSVPGATLTRWSLYETEPPLTPALPVRHYVLLGEQEVTVLPAFGTAVARASLVVGASPSSLSMRAAELDAVADSFRVSP